MAVGQMTHCWWKPPPLKDKVPASAPDVEHQRTSDVAGAALQPCLETATSAADAAQPEVTFKGWHKMWESAPNGLPTADIGWLKEDEERGLFQRATSYKDKHRNTRWRKVLKDERVWFHTPEFPGVVEGKVPSADSFYHSPVFFLEISQSVALQSALSKA